MLVSLLGTWYNMSTATAEQKIIDDSQEFWLQQEEKKNECDWTPGKWTNELAIEERSQVLKKIN